MSQSILYPTDFSACAANALPFAVDIAQRMEGYMTMLHVFEIPYMPPANIFTTSEHTMLKSKEEAERNIVQHLEQVVKDNALIINDTPTQVIAEEGNPGNEIERFCEEHNAHMVVMGTKGAKGLKEFFMGSVASAVIRKVECPVLVVPEDATFKPFKKILYATELKYHEEPYFKMVVDFARLYDATITFLHIDSSGKSKETTDESSLTEFLDKNDYGKVAFVKVKAEDELQAIEDYIVEHEKDLLAMTTYTHSLVDRIFNESATQKEAMHTQTPLLAFSNKIHSWVII